jgi:hypothetical protein
LRNSNYLEHLPDFVRYFIGAGALTLLDRNFHTEIGEIDHTNCCQQRCEDDPTYPDCFVYIHVRIRSFFFLEIDVEHSRRHPDIVVQLCTGSSKLNRQQIEVRRKVERNCSSGVQRFYLHPTWLDSCVVIRGVQVSEVFHAGAPGAQFQPDGRSGRVSGPAPDHASYSSFATFSDPDGNGWLLQEITTRLPGRIDAAQTAFASTAYLASALRRAETAHGEHEKRTGQRDANWPDWYAAYMVAEQAGEKLPS